MPGLTPHFALLTEQINILIVDFQHSATLNRHFAVSALSVANIVQLFLRLELSVGISQLNFSLPSCQSGHASQLLASKREIQAGLCFSICPSSGHGGGGRMRVQIKAKSHSVHYEGRQIVEVGVGVYSD